MPAHTTVRELAPTPGYAHVAVLDDNERLVLTAGAVPLDENGKLVGEGDLELQTHQVLRNLAQALEAVGSGLRMVVKTTVYVVASEREDLARAWNVVRESNLSDAPHASTLLGVSLLGFPGQLIEIEALAVVPSHAQGVSQ
jgi:enamine deaminase RidA (YjgF/YER057c/UK114 family)